MKTKKKTQTAIIKYSHNNYFTLKSFLACFQICAFQGISHILKLTLEALKSTHKINSPTDLHIFHLSLSRKNW